MSALPLTTTEMSGDPLWGDCRLFVSRTTPDLPRLVRQRSIRICREVCGSAGELNRSAQHFLEPRRSLWLAPIEGCLRQMSIEIWCRLRAGHAAKPTTRQLGLSTSTVRTYPVAVWWGPARDPRSAAGGSAQFRAAQGGQGLAFGRSLRAIAVRFDRVAVDDQPRSGRQRWSPRLSSGRRGPTAWSHATRPKTCKLANNSTLAGIVAEKLQHRWSPQQIAGWLRLTYPHDPGDAQVSHESIYRTCTCSRVVRCAGNSPPTCAPAG